MPIKGLTDANIGARGLMQRLGKLRKGKKNDRGLPTNLDYFLVDFADGFKHLEGLFVELYGTQPKSFDDIIIWGNTVDEAFPNYLKEYNSAGQLLTVSDGINVTYRYDPETDTRDSTPVPYVESEWLVKDGKRAGKPRLSPQGILLVTPTDFMMRSGISGYFQIDVGSINEIRAIHEVLCGVEAAVGRIQGVPFVLKRSDQLINKPFTNKDGSVKRRKSEESLISIHPTEVFSRDVIYPALASGGLQSDTPQLTSGVDYDDDTGEVYEDDVIDADVPQSNPFYDEPWHNPTAADLQKFSEYIHANINKDMQLSDVLAGLQELYPTLINDWGSLGEIGITKAFVVAVAINIHCDWELDVVTQFAQSSNNDTFAYLMDTITAQQEMRMASFQF